MVCIERELTAYGLPVCLWNELYLLHIQVQADDDEGYRWSYKGLRRLSCCPEHSPVSSLDIGTLIYLSGYLFTKRQNDYRATWEICLSHWWQRPLPGLPQSSAAPGELSESGNDIDLLLCYGLGTGIVCFWSSDCWQTSHYSFAGEEDAASHVSR